MATLFWLDPESSTALQSVQDPLQQTSHRYFARLNMPQRLRKQAGYFYKVSWMHCNNWTEWRYRDSGKLHFRNTFPVSHSSQTERGSPARPTIKLNTKIEYLPDPQALCLCSIADKWSSAWRCPGYRTRR
jgi:hypothetical protein